MIRLFLCLFLLSCARAEDFRPLVMEALKRGDKQVVIPPGTYWLNPTSGGELWNLSNLKDVEIVADDVTRVGTKVMRATSLFRCSSMPLQGLTIDAPLHTEASYGIARNTVVWVENCKDVVTYEKNAMKKTGSFAGKPIQLSKGM